MAARFRAGGLEHLLRRGRFGGPTRCELQIHMKKPHTMRRSQPKGQPVNSVQLDEAPVTSTTVSGIPRGAPIIHSFIMHPDGSVQDMKRYSLRRMAETAREIRESRVDL
jgi:hypothetical protein